MVPRSREARDAAVEVSVPVFSPLRLVRPLPSHVVDVENMTTAVDQWRVLVVDDEPRTSEALRHLLAAEGYYGKAL